MPANPAYLPVEVGAALRKEHFFSTLDSQGENISAKNKSYCELTGIYWAYKNLDYDILGLVHYRRYFLRSGLFVRKNLQNVLPKNKIELLLQNHDIIVPKKRYYYVESNYSHYVHAHVREPLDLTAKIIQRDYPEYFPAFQKRMKKTSGHYFNMFIANHDVAKGYLDWLFDILFKVESQLDTSTYSQYDQRVYGFLSELLLDVYIDTNHLKVREQRVAFMEKQNWFKKIKDFLLRKLSKGKKGRQQK